MHTLFEWRPGGRRIKNENMTPGAGFQISIMGISSKPGGDNNHPQQRQESTQKEIE
jgi:hypothetical protein